MLLLLCGWVRNSNELAGDLYLNTNKIYEVGRCAVIGRYGYRSWHNPAGSRKLLGLLSSARKEKKRKNGKRARWREGGETRQSDRQAAAAMIFCWWERGRKTDHFSNPTADAATA